MTDILQYQFETETAYKAFRHYFGNDYGIHYADSKAPCIAFFTERPQSPLRGIAEIFDAAVLILSTRQEKYNDNTPYILMYDDGLKLVSGELRNGLTEAAQKAISDLAAEMTISKVNEPTGREMVEQGIHNYCFELHGNRFNVVKPGNIEKPDNPARTDNLALPEGPDNPKGLRWQANRGVKRELLELLLELDIKPDLAYSVMVDMADGSVLRIEAENTEQNIKVTHFPAPTEDA